MKTSYKGYAITVENDDDSMNPRIDWDNVGTMVCFHKRYELGDKEHGYNENSYSCWSELEDDIKRNEKPLVILPIYMYDHSGITINTTGFSCGFDGGQIGFIYATKKSVKDILGKATIEEVTKCLISEVEVYDRYLSGEVLRYSIEKNGETMDNCGSYFESEEYVLNEAKDIVNTYIKYDIKKHLEQVKIWVKNRVPYQCRTSLNLQV